MRPQLVGSQLDRSIGALYGLAAGDALGAPVEFKRRGTFPLVTDMRAGGPFDLAAGEWTDDTSMALALGYSLLAKRLLVKQDVMHRWGRWMRHGEYSHNGRCFDIGDQTRSALMGHKGVGMGNGGLMRLAPVAMFDPHNAGVLGAMQSSFTHPVTCSPAAFLFGDMLGQFILTGESSVFDELLSRRGQGIPSSSGYVWHAFDAAVWAVGTSSSFAEAVLKAVNLGDDSDTVGAVTGQLAGARWGYSSIPWRVVWHEQILKLASDLSK